MDRNYLIDLVLSIAQDATDEWHLKEKISGKEKELKTVSPEEMPELYEKLTEEINELIEDYVDGAILRRKKTDILGELSPNYDFHSRCTLKHRGAAFVMATEAFLANPTHKGLYEVMAKSEERFWKAVSQFMGVKEIEDCGRCLSDQLNRDILNREQ